MPLFAQYRSARKGSASCVNGDTGWRNRMKNGLFWKFNHFGSRLFQKIHGFREMSLQRFRATSRMRGECTLPAQRIRTEDVV
jgi:hypothetical protein